MGPIGVSTATKYVPPGVERLIELGRQVGGATHLSVGAPFRTERSEPVLAITRERVEKRIAARITGQSQTHAQVIGTPSFFDCVHCEHPFARFLEEPVTHAFEITRP